MYTNIFRNKILSSPSEYANNNWNTISSNYIVWVQAPVYSVRWKRKLGALLGGLSNTISILANSKAVYLAILFYLQVIEYENSFLYITALSTNYTFNIYKRLNNGKPQVTVCSIHQSLFNINERKVTIVLYYLTPSDTSYKGTCLYMIVSYTYTNK
mgnify:CR=1 FL=1